jgi:hypothetical protein
MNESGAHSTAHAYMATQQLEEHQIARSLEEFLREPQYYVALE